MKKLILLLAVWPLQLFATAPVISAVKAQVIDSSSAKITWTTNQNSDSRVNYGLTSSYGMTQKDLSSMVTSHSVMLTGLHASTTYNFRVRSKNSSGQMATTGNFQFKTADDSPTPPPPISGGLPPGTSWYWQLQGTINTTRAASVYDIDLEDSSTSLIASLKQSGHTVICYFSAGTYEDWRSDAGQFPSSALGKTNGWPGEKWLDIRNSQVRQIMLNRMNTAVSKGCDGLEPDNVDGFQNGSGFPLTAQDEINYLNFLADNAHSRGMIIALKNATDLVTSVVAKFDFAVVEECFKYNECSAYSPFIKANKAVLNAEYTSISSATCTKAKSLQFSTVFFNLDLNGKVFNPCP
jgi:hypothetical protein